MSNPNNYCVIMAGGIGSRFWPMSRTTFPKQFIDILGTGQTLIQQTFERLLKIYLAHGMKAQNLTPNVKGLAAFTNSPLSEYMVHYKGNLKQKISKEEVTPDVNLPRYRQLADLVRTYATDSIVEVGTWNGGRAIEMSLAAFEKTDTLHYTGFDLFENATTETDELEFNDKAHNALEAVTKRLTEFAEKMKEKDKTFTFNLYKGDSKKTLKKHRSKLKNVSFAFIDGGNSEKTKKADYDNLDHVPVIVLIISFPKIRKERLLTRNIRQ